MSSSRRSAGSEDSILASLERGSPGTRAHRSWLIIGGSAAAVLTLMIAWLAYGNATSVRALPQSAVKRPADPPVDDGMLSQTLPSISIPATQAAAIVDEPGAETASRPAMVMLPTEKLDVPETSAPVAALPQEERVSRPAPTVKPAPAKAAASRQAARSTKSPAARPETRTAAAKKPKTAPPQAAGHEADSDVALLSAILAHSTRHAVERAQMEKESCQGKKCASKASTKP
ncbi:hypothetical protein HHL21_12955 [Massilia sp. RP-1-19]|uniref:Uncharacterized protein n=1 Tax=Massilia polaris TaxID=2728846 RepID=A0A848HP90_9BURK|nr:hypothetical protein [Massilia polaris]NML61970.1 hypothetical protein [Massilia polaris]